MTSPSGQTPANAANAETFAGWAQTTEAEWKDEMLGKFQKPYQGIGDWARSLRESPLTQIPVLGGIITTLTNTILGVEKVATQAGSVANATANIAVTTGFYDGQYFIRQTYVANGKWTPPAIPPGAKRTGYGIQCIGGGEGGGMNAYGVGEGAPGGRNGGLAYRQLTVNQMGPGERDVTIGAGGVGAADTGYGQIGGLTKFSNLLSSVPGGTSIQTVQGIMGSSARPGSGGRGGSVFLKEVTDTTISWTGTFGQDGESTSGASGGRGGAPSVKSGGWFPNVTPGTLPQPGQDAPADDALATGGGGGGGGAGGARADGQPGATGGDPGGGGGGGGAAMGTKSGFGNPPAVPGSGGTGRNGRCDIWTFYTMEEAA